MHIRFKPIIIQADSGEELCAFGNVLSVMLGGEQTDGKLAVMSEATTPGGGSPPRIHRNEDELFSWCRDVSAISWVETGQRLKWAALFIFPKAWHTAIETLGIHPAVIGSSQFHQGSRSFLSAVPKSLRNLLPKHEPHR